jgi:RNA polymerase sigma-70 factor, ECF subfamily
VAAAGLHSGLCLYTPSTDGVKTLDDRKSENPTVHETAPGDELLIQRIAEGDETSLAALHDRYRLFAYTLAVRVLGDAARAEDVVQDAFLAVWRRGATYSGDRGSVRTWLATIVRNRAIDLVRSRRERMARPDRDDTECLQAVVDPAPGVVEAVVSAMERDAVRSAIGELPEEQRHAIGLAFFRGLSHSEISAQTGVPLGTVKSRIRLGIQRLRGSLAGSGLGYA